MTLRALALRVYTRLRECWGARVLVRQMRRDARAGLTPAAYCPRPPRFARPFDPREPDEPPEAWER